MFRKFVIYLFLAFIVGCGSSLTVKKDVGDEKPEKTESECKKHYNIGFEYSKMKMYDDAKINFEKAIECSLTYVDAYLALAKVYSETQEYGLSEIAYNDLILNVPGTIKGYIGLGALYTKMGKYSEAEDPFNIALGMDSLDASIYHGLGHLYVKQKVYDKAIEMLEKAYNLEPDNRAIAYELAKTYLKLENCKEASTILAKIAEEFPNDIELGLSLGDAYLDCKEYSKALAQYEKIEDALSEFASIYTRKAKALVGLKRYSEAAEALLKAIELSENKLIPYYHLINMYLKISNYGKAQTYIKDAFTIAPNDPALNCMNGDVYIGYGDAARTRARRTKKKKDYETAIAHYGTAKVWYGKARGDPKWGQYAGKGIEVANSKITNTKNEMYYGD